MNEHYNEPARDDYVDVDEVQEVEGPQELRPGVTTTEPEFREAAKPEGQGDLYVNYTSRGPGDVVLSGPITSGWGPGRYFRNRREAYAAMCAKHGADRVRFLEGVTRGRWSYLVKGLKKV